MRSRWLPILIALAACGRRDAAGSDPTPHVSPMQAEDDSCNPAKPRICLGDDVVACEADGHLGRRLRACHKGCKDGKCQRTCEDDDVKLIYLVDAANDFMSFDPRKLPGDPFHVIGKLRCGRYGGSAFSMSVDRNGTAWVVFDNGELYKVSITDASCEPTSFSPGAAGGAATFGMGFATDQAGGDTEKLFIAENSASNMLASIDTEHSLAPHRIGLLTATVDANPELTGTSDAKLYGFYPSRFGESFVQEIDRTSGAPIGRQWSVGDIGAVEAYAFAQWGGAFYVFATVGDGFIESNSTVRMIDKASGTFRTVMQHLPYRITGAGVSTCAPERDQ